METRDRLAGPIARYINHGDHRPSHDKLSDLVHYLSGNSGKPASRLFLADAFIDLSMAGVEPEQPLNEARDELSSIIDDANFMEESGFTNESVNFAGFATSAALRLGELGSWTAASNGNIISPQYDDFLLRSYEASRFATINRAAVPLLAEGIPVLLGRRAQSRYGTGWTSRLSLLREDQSVFSVKGVNANWDVGVAKDNTAASYETPQTRLQIKINESRKKAAYRRGDIVFISASALGFQACHRIIKSCMKEADPDSVSRSSKQSKFLSSDEIDEITTRLKTKITHD